MSSSSVTRRVSRLIVIYLDRVVNGGPTERSAGVRFSLRGENPLEWTALRTGLVPTPAVEAWAGMALSGALVAATRLGVTARLATGAASADEVAVDLGLDPTATRLLLECLCGIGHVRLHAGRYRLSRASRRWLDPDSRQSVAHFIAGTGDYAPWWSGLADVARSGTPYSHHSAAPEDPYWQRYIRGQMELARTSAPEVARRFPLPANARSLLDVGGGHGCYAAELCRRHPGLSATVLDLPGSARVGRAIIAEAGMADRVSHREGDALTADLGDRFDGVLCFNLIHHLDEGQIVRLFTKIRVAMAPGGSFGILDAFAPPAGRRSAAASFVGLFMYMSSGAQVYTATQLHRWLDDAGFAPPRRMAIRRMPGLTLYAANPAG